MNNEKVTHFGIQSNLQCGAQICTFIRTKTLKSKKGEGTVYPWPFPYVNVHIYITRNGLSLKNLCVCISLLQLRGGVDIDVTSNGVRAYTQSQIGMLIAEGFPAPNIRDVRAVCVRAHILSVVNDAPCAHMRVYAHITHTHGWPFMDIEARLIRV